MARPDAAGLPGASIRDIAVPMSPAPPHHRKVLKDDLLFPDFHRPDFVTSLAKGLKVLATFEHGSMLGIDDLVGQTGLPKTTVSRLAGTLAALGYLRIDERTRKYTTGARLLGIGGNVQRHVGLQRIARPFMEKMAQVLDTTIILSARSDKGMMFLELARPPRSRLTVNTDSGQVVPMESTSMGLAYLVMAPLKERVRLLEAIQQRHRGDWYKVRRNIEHAFTDYQRYGFVVSHHTGRGTVSGTAVPLVYGAKGIFTFSCTGPSCELSRARLSRSFAPVLLQTVSEIEAAIHQGRHRGQRGPAD